VKGVERYESLVGLGRVVISQLAEIMLAEVVVNAIFVGAISEVCVVILDGVRSAEVAEAQTDDSIGVGDAAFIFLFVRLIEVVTDRYL
jgi:hypothetical protein